MTVPNILMARIDNRLIHGQVGLRWVGTLGCNLIVLADDIVAVDPVQQSIMKISADYYEIGIRFFTVEKTIEVINNASPSQKIFIVVRDPQSARKLIDNGVPIEKLCVGNIHKGPGKKQTRVPFVYLDDQDLEDLRAIRKKGVEVFIQILPGDLKSDFEIN